MEPTFTVGVVIGTHGLKGDVRVFPRTDFPELRFTAGSQLLLMRSDQTVIALEVLSARKQNRLYIVSFVGYASIDEVQAFRGCELKVAQSQLAALSPGEYYIHDLIGCAVYTDDTDRLGVLVDVLTPGANDVYVVKTESGKDILLPAIPDCILRVDIESKRIDAHLMPGLLD